jgi:hypothetical protein
MGIGAVRQNKAILKNNSACTNRLPFMGREYLDPATFLTLFPS